MRRFPPLFLDAARPCRHVAGDRWFIDKTYVKVAGRWIYLYRAIDQFGQVIEILELRSARVISTGHAFNGELRRGHLRYISLMILVRSFWVSAGESASIHS